jgi:hypothetical protein
MSIRLLLIVLLGCLTQNLSFAFAQVDGEKHKSEKEQVEAAVASRDGAIEIKEKSLLWYLDQSLKAKQRAEEANSPPPKAAYFKKVKKNYDAKTRKYDSYARRLESRARRLEHQADKAMSLANKARERASFRLKNVELITKEATAIAEGKAIQAKGKFDARKREVERWTVLIEETLAKETEKAREEAERLIKTAIKLSRITEEEAMSKEAIAEGIRVKAGIAEEKASKVRDKAEFMKRKS